VSQHYFTPHPTAPHRPGMVRVVTGDAYLELDTDSGVFSPGRLDPGTRLLLDSAPAPSPDGDLLDLGCGYGPIACVLATRSPGATVWGVDVNQRALDLTARNALKAGLSNVRTAVAPYPLPTGPDRPPGDPALPGVFKTIWSNPPIRIGKPALHSLLVTWLDRLAPGGQAALVVSRNLGSDSLQRWLAEDQGWPVTRLAARSGYRLLVIDYTERRTAGAP
jgi:16S rRNA (guanine1207-N2)-methyltransferase